MGNSGMAMSNLYIVIPAYNEQANIRGVIQQWYPVVERCGEGSRLVVIDDGSLDATYPLVCEAARSYPALIPLTKKNQGHGATVLFGYRYALDAGADYVFQTDSDGQTDPAEFKELWDARESYDILLGRRAAREDGISRAVVTRMLKAVVKQRFGVALEDANTPYRLMRAAALRDCLAYIPDDYNLANVAISVASVKFGYSVHDFPIAFHARQGGKNSINLFSIARMGRQALRDFRHINEVLDREAAFRCESVNAAFPGMT